MSLASGAHISLAGVEYDLDEATEDHYLHILRGLSAGQDFIPGTEGEENPDKDRLLWKWDDWSGGEGARLFDESDPSAYDYATGSNGRIKGQLTGAPNRTQVQVTAMGDNNQRAFLQVSQGILYVACDEKIKQSTDYGASFAAPGGTLGITSGDNISAVTGDSAHFYYATKEGSATREIRRLTGSSNSEAVLSRGTTNPAGHFQGMAMLQGKLYGWTGRKLFEFDVFETVPLTFNTTYRKVYDSGVELTMSSFGGTAQGSWWADCVAGENAIYCFAGSEGHTEVYIYKDGVGRPLWRLPFGMTGKTLTYQNGILYVTGHYSSEAATADGYGALWALPLKTLQETFITFFRKNQGTFLHMQEACNSQGYQILIGGAKSGKVFVYDAEFNAISLLDDFAVAPAPSNWVAGESKIGAMTHIGNHRIVVFYQPGGASGTTLETLNYADDEVPQREATGTLSTFAQSGEWNFNFPHAMKGLVGFYVNFLIEDAATTSGLLANQRIAVAYQLDNAAYVTAGTVTSASTPLGTKGRVFILVSDPASGGTTKKFYRLRLKVTLDNNATSGVKPPVLQALTAEAALVDYAERWRFVIRAKKEVSRNARPSRRSTQSDVLRDAMEDLATNKNFIELLDGYREKENDQYTTHKVVVESVEDSIARNGEGTVAIVVRSINPV